MHITNRLTLHPVGWLGNGLDMRNWTDAFEYSVEGLPLGEQAWIARIRARCWQILRLINGVQGHWTGEYASAEEALNALQKQVDFL